MVTAALTALKSTNNDLGIVFLWLNCERTTDGSGIEPSSGSIVACGQCNPLDSETCRSGQEKPRRVFSTGMRFAQSRWLGGYQNSSRACVGVGQSLTPSQRAPARGNGGAACGDIINEVSRQHSQR